MEKFNHMPKMACGPNSLAWVKVFATGTCWQYDKSLEGKPVLPKKMLQMCADNGISTNVSKASSYSWCETLKDLTKRNSSALLLVRNICFVPHSHWVVMAGMDGDDFCLYDPSYDKNHMRDKVPFGNRRANTKQMKWLWDIGVGIPSMRFIYLEVQYTKK